ncbi:hypothetical protein TRFO_36492 [Tritrichomonas foetus]|uniref:Uncharacterized protein n=1 Tax=Tritrichomonas foetus TaxID=1144522 RepID=A0A1J4JGB0_9EUKA|nr:hypothetical protein TRFO_36492 [Tritrichomonas foetus]|eukprot:OHS97335.1 hypothetical protein TRFO_36492 [Tritrichomonas foetus]
MESFLRVEMNEKTNLFQTVFLRLIETLSPQIHIILTDFENKSKTSNPNTIINFIFETFPRDIPQYLSIIQSLTKVAAVDPKGVIDYLAGIFLAKNDNSVFLSLNSLSIIFKHNDSGHCEIYKYFIHFFMADLISSIVLSHNVKSESLISCVRSLYNENFNNFKNRNKIIRQWAVIISHQDFKDVEPIFDEFSNTEECIITFKLFQFINLDLFDSSSFMNKIYLTLKLLYKKKLLVNSLFHCLAKLFISIKNNKEVLNNIFDFCNSIKNEKQLKNGIYDLMATIFLHIKKSQIPSFYQKHVFAHVADKSKVHRSLSIFQKNIFGLETNLNWLFFEWGIMKASSTMCFVKWNSEPEKKMSAPDSFANLFMSTFFTKSDFSVCPELFCDVIIHIASLDYSYFLKTILPKFIKLSANDHRFLVFLMTVPLINSDDFMLNSYAELPTDYANEFNSKIRSKIINSIDCFDDIEYNDYGAYDLLENSLILDADQQIAVIQQELQPLKCSWKKCERRPSDHLIQINLLKCIPYVVNEDDFIEPEILVRLLKLSYNANLGVSIAAITAIRHFSLNEKCKIPLLQNALNLFSKIDEIRFTLLTLILNVFDNIAVNELNNMENEIIKNIECSAFICLSSPLPILRIIAFNTLKAINKIFKQNSIAFIILNALKEIESCVSHRLDFFIDFHTALMSNYYDIWLVFLSEIIPHLTENNKLLSTITSIDPDTVPIIIFHSYACEDEPIKYINFLKTINNNDILKQILPNCSSSLFGGIIYSLPFSLNQQHILMCASVVNKMIRSPHLSDDDYILPAIVNFLASLQAYIINQEINSPRVINWDDQKERKVIDNLPFIVDYCNIILAAFRNISENQANNSWPFSNRALVFRFLVNWGMIVSDKLESLRALAKRALSYIIQTGSLFNDSLLFDHSAVEFFASIDINVLSILLQNHVDLLLDIFVDACFTQPIEIGERYFQAIYSILDISFYEYLYEECGEIFLIGAVYKILENPYSTQFMDKLVEVIAKKKNFKIRSNLQNQFSFCTERIISSALNYIKNPSTHISIKDIVLAIRSFISSIRILPKQTSLVPGTPSLFKQFTPYKFLETLMTTTISVSKSDFKYIASLWIDLLKCPDHSELIPLFINEYPENIIKPQLLSYLIKNNTPFVVKRLTLHTSFAFYFYTTTCLSKDFKKELWFVPLLIEAMEVNSPEIDEKLIQILHFSILFQEKQLILLLARKLSVEISQNFMIHTINAQEKDSVINQYYDKKILTQNKNDDVQPIIMCFIRNLDVNQKEIWGKEALKWIMASQNIEFAYLSLFIYNRILRPFEKLVVTGICKSVVYHLVNFNGEKEEILDMFVGESFLFYNSVFNNNEKYAYQFLSSFFDCSFFFTSLHKYASHLYMKALKAPQTNQQAWGQLIGFIRPFLNDLENNEQNQILLDQLIQSSQSEELIMIAYPLKEIYPNMFPKLNQISLRNASLNTYCAALVHYSCMIDNASSALLNSIFGAINVFINVVANAYNRNPLVKLYKAALNNLSTCPNSIEFIINLSKSCPDVLNDVFDFYDWNRSIDDVCHSLGSIFDFENTNIPNLTDCSTLASVYNLLNCDSLPKILPFDHQRETIEAMIKVTNEVKKKRSTSFRRVSHGFFTRRDSTPLSSFDQLEYSPLHTPSSVFIKHYLFENKSNDSITTSSDEFIRSLGIKSFSFDINHINNNTS